MKKIFVSYSRADYVDEDGNRLNESAVANIVETLRNQGLDIWIDANEKYSGKYFTSVLAKQILASDVVLFLSSAKSNSSKWVKREILFANENEKEILPVKIDDSPFNVDFALVLSGIDYIDYYINPELKNVELLETLLDGSKVSTLVATDSVSLPANSKKSSSATVKKGRIKIDIKYKGCALGMTVLLGVLFLFLIIPGGETNKDNGDLIAYQAPHDDSSEPQLNPRRTAEGHRGAYETSPSIHRSNSSMQMRENTKSATPKRSDTEKQITKKDAIQIHDPAASSSNATCAINANGVDTLKMMIYGGQKAFIKVACKADPDYDVLIYDEGNNLVASSKNSSDHTTYVSWTPQWSGFYNIVIKNRGKTKNRYTISYEPEQ
jgi:MTH538 TIR-like domain (DUF1863).